MSTNLYLWNMTKAMDAAFEEETIRFLYDHHWDGNDWVLNPDDDLPYDAVVTFPALDGTFS